MGGRSGGGRGGRPASRLGVRNSQRRRSNGAVADGGGKRPRACGLPVEAQAPSDHGSNAGAALIALVEVFVESAAANIRA